MNIYTKKQWWKFFLFLVAVLIGIGSLLYTNSVVKRLTREEMKKIKLWAEATEKLITSNLNDNSTQFLLEIIQDNNTIPVMVVDETGRIQQFRNLDTTRMKDPVYREKRLEKMKEYQPPILIDIPEIPNQYIFYDKSIILTRLSLYPYLQLGVIMLFILIAYFAFSTSRRAEQNQVWVGMSKETAHQLGTPTSSLLALKELIKMNNPGDEIIQELEKDVNRLETITERFSKIGSKPVLKKENLKEVIQNAVKYLESRASERVKFSVHCPGDAIELPMNKSLFEWVIENISKNAMDAMNGAGSINIKVEEKAKNVVIDITDTGKGIPKSKHKTIFKPGFTTKQRGWGLGLSLTKRIVEENHKGRIFVASSEANKGTTFRIILNK